MNTVVIGHMAVVDWSDLRENAEFHKRFLATVQAAAKARQSVDDFVKEYVWPGIVAAPTQEAQFASWRTNYVQAIYDALRK